MEDSVGVNINPRPISEYIAPSKQALLQHLSQRTDKEWITRSVEMTQDIDLRMRT